MKVYPAHKSVYRGRPSLHARERAPGHSLKKSVQTLESNPSVCKQLCLSPDTGRTLARPTCVHQALVAQEDQRAVKETYGQLKGVITPDGPARENARWTLSLGAFG